MLGSCLFGAESPLQLLACRGRLVSARLMHSLLHDQKPHTFFTCNKRPDIVRSSAYASNNAQEMFRAWV
ncbi:hypothetical protein NBRC111894_4052 [Sporolactobacillus inulinus]|uniref:Uncharacterized protein n=1 Tax=Sporolactobacillus inulinus TaxID=2078 RepID=A0A4Y1ZJD8_9BACL|nr:hypothetical protein NBRC111894_4052 [Sporolactobacillus inulinus]